MSENRATRWRRLQAAGYRCINDVWVPAAEAERVRKIAAEHEAEVQRIAAEPQTLGAPRRTPAPDMVATKPKLVRGSWSKR